MLDRMASSLINKLTGKYSPQIDRFRFRWKPLSGSSQYWILNREKYLEITSFSPNGLSMYIGFPSGSLAVIWWLYTSVLSSADTKTQSTAAWLLISLLLPLTFRDYRFTQSIKPLMLLIIHISHPPLGIIPFEVIRVIACERHEQAGNSGLRVPHSDIERLCAVIVLGVLYGSY